MPKLKTKKSYTKRVRVTGKGKVVRGKPGRRHLLGGKSSKSKRQMRRKAVVGQTEMQVMRRGMPYAF
jgi:large subunit ribosomal protein L35